MGAIALINHAFDDGDKTWELDWLQNRMRFVESAQNMGYDLEGAIDVLQYQMIFNTHYYSETIYYTATTLQVREYKKRILRLEEEDSPTTGVAVDATTKSQRAFSDIYGGPGQSWQQSQQLEQREVDADAGGNKAMIEKFEQLQKTQFATLLEQQEAYKALLAAYEEQKRELALLKGQQQQ